MKIEIELPDDDRTGWVLSSLHEHGLRLCNDVACVRVISWRTMAASTDGVRTADDRQSPTATTHSAATGR